MAGITSQSVPSYVVTAEAVEGPSRTTPAGFWREILAVVLFVTLADFVIYRGAGYAGIAAFLIGAPLLLLLGALRRLPSGSFWILSAMLFLLAARMLWLGSTLSVIAGLVLLVAYSLAIHGRHPYFSEVLAGSLKLVVAGAIGLATYARGLARCFPRLPRFLGLNLLLPAAAVVIFGTLFILANPDVVKLVAECWDRFSRWLADWAGRISEHWLEVLFWFGAAYFAAGLLRPLLHKHRDRAEPLESGASPLEKSPVPSPLYHALRNTLLAVIALFAVYLVFEFKTLWFRKLPPGFYYAGYAHEGAAWLTAALALATLALSLIFRGSILRDPRVASLRNLALIWSAQNLLLALTVYNRLYIYIDFNGMTRMRAIGLFGTSTVVVGFALVLWKILSDRDFVWLIHRQIWALAIAVYLYALTPVDLLVHRYNVARILSGDLAPSVQISVQPINAEGLLVLSPLAQCPDSIIRDGVCALLAEHEIAAEQRVKTQFNLGWTATQFADRTLLKELRAHHHYWQPFTDDAHRAHALQRFHKYAYQWY